MNKHSGLTMQCLLLLLLLPATAHLQTIPFLGTKTPYPSPEKNKVSAPPAGYAPVFINYTGRHGSRFMTKAGADAEVVQLLAYADQQNALTPLGKKIKTMAERFLAIQQAGYENITLLGAAEQEAIAERIRKNYSPAFKGNGVDITMTYKVRTQQSAAAFVKGLPGYTGEKRNRIIPEGEDDVLRFYDLSPAYQDFKKSDALKKRSDSLQADPRTMQAARNTCGKIFNEDFAKKLLQGSVSIEIKNKKIAVNGIGFTQSLFEVYTMQFSVPLEMKQKGYSVADIDFSAAFDHTDLAWLDRIGGAQDFLEKGAGLDTLGIQVTVAMPLLADYINTTQAMINGAKKTDGVFRFTHAEAISPFATLLGIPEASHPDASVFTCSDHWQASHIIPLSANIGWIIYSDGQHYLVKALLNEKEVRLPIVTNTFPFYRWEDVKQYYLAKMKRLHTAPGEDMHRYLLDLH